MNSGNKKRLLLFITEGPTEEEFYKKVIEYTKKTNNCKKYNFDKIKYICPDGITRIQNKALLKFKNEICLNKDYSGYKKIVCLCYDLDVLNNNNNSCLSNNIDKMKTELKKCGADKVIEIKADRMIEDFFLYDIEGIKDFLKLKNYKLPNKKSLDLLKQMFKDGNKIYSKGSSAAGFIKALNLGKILSKICNQLSPLCDELGYKCNRKNCKN